MSCQVLAACLSKTRGWRSDKMLAGPGENAVFRATGKAGRKKRREMCPGECLPALDILRFCPLRASVWMFMCLFVCFSCVMLSFCACKKCPE